MRITRVHLRNYKRFTDLRITDIPQSARLVVLVGPNGSGKSSVFDAFLLKSHSSRNNWPLSDGIFGGYLLKVENETANLSNTRQVANTIDIDTDTEVQDWSKAFTVRSPYRHEADFSNTNLGPAQSNLPTSPFASNASSIKIKLYQTISIDFPEAQAAVRCTGPSRANQQASL